MTFGPDPPDVPVAIERCVPAADNTGLVYEHLHRYHFAAARCAGKRVLDFGSGEGFGAAILAATARHVIAIDRAADVVSAAAEKYPLPGIRFVCGDECAVGEIGPGGVDVVVCLEVIEHVDDQPGLIATFANLLADDGVLVLSTPDREAAENAADNPFHTKELSADELVALLGSQFPHVELYRQSLTMGSRIVRSDNQDGLCARTQYVDVVRNGDDWGVRDTPLGGADPYLVAVAGRRVLPESADLSVLGDRDLIMFRHAENAAIRARDAHDLAYRLAERDLTRLRSQLYEAELDLARWQHRWHSSTPARVRRVLHAHRPRALTPGVLRVRVARFRFRVGQARAGLAIRTRIRRRLGR